MSEPTYAADDAARPTAPPKLEQWSDFMDSANHRLQGACSEINGFCDRLAGARQEDPTSGGGADVKRLEQAGAMASVQSRADVLAETIARVEAAVSRLNSLGL